MPRYDFKTPQELLWFAVVAASVAALQIVLHADVAAVTDWRAWTIALGAAAVRAAAAVLLARLAGDAVPDVP